MPADKAAPSGAAWVMLIAAPPVGKGSEPVLVWSGWTGVSKGEHGEERVGVVFDEPAAAGKGRRVLVGERRADVAICGRPSLVGARELDPSTLELVRGASVQNLSDAERQSATKITAERVTSGDRPRPR